MFEVKTINDVREVMILTNQNTMGFMLQVLREHEGNAKTEYDRKEAGRLHAALSEAMGKARAAWISAKTGAGTKYYGGKK